MPCGGTVPTKGEGRHSAGLARFAGNHREDRMLSGILSIAAAAVLVGIDQLLKVWATANLQPIGAMTLIPHVVELRYSLNEGMAFSLLWGKQGFLIAVTSVALIVLLGYLLLRKPPLLERIAWTLVLGGGVGNLIDRIASGQVVDYINFLFVDFAIFNFADICVTVGVALLFVCVLWCSRRQMFRHGFATAIFCIPALPAHANSACWWAAPGPSALWWKTSARTCGSAGCGIFSVRSITADDPHGAAQRMGDRYAFMFSAAVSAV